MANKKHQVTKKINTESAKAVEVELSILQLDESYQRGEKRNRYAILENFDPAAAGTLHVARRSDGTLWLIDGQQRRWAMMELKIRRWLAFIIDSSGPEYEAVIFNLLNGQNRMQLTARELFRAALRANDPVALSVKAATEAAGLKLQDQKGAAKWPAIACVGALYRLTAKHGEAIVARALTVVAKTWPDQEAALKDLIPVATIGIYARQGDIIDDQRFIEVMGKIAPQKILNDAAVAVTNRHYACTDVIARLYNKGLRQKTKRLRLCSETIIKDRPDRGAREDQTVDTDSESA